MDQLAARVAELGLSDLTVEGDYPLLRHYHVKRNGSDVYMFFNESATPVKTTVTLQNQGTFARLRLIEDAAWQDSANGKTELNLLPGQSEIWVFGDEATAMTLPTLPALSEVATLTPTYTIEVAESEDLTAYTPYKTTNQLINITASGELPHFSGKMRYTFEWDLDEVPSGATLDLGRVGETARLWVNGRDVGIRITAPYAFAVEPYLKAGKNHVVVEVSNTLVGKVRDGFSYHMVIRPSGLLGPVRLMGGE